MTDKYEEFKKWFKKNKYGIWKVNDFKIPLTAETVININDVFDIFEKEQAEKQKEKEIKEAIHDGVMEVATRIDSYGNWTESVYQKLKEKDLIK